MFLFCNEIIYDLKLTFKVFLSKILFAINECKRLLFPGCPQYRLFFTSLTVFERQKVSAQKLKKQFFQGKFYSFKGHAYYFTVLIYLATWRAAKLGIFTDFTFTKLHRCSLSMNSLIYVCSIQISSWFLWVIDQSWSHFFVLPSP